MKTRHIGTVLIGLAALCASSPALAQRLGGGATPEVSIVRIVGALIISILVALLAILYIKHRGGGALPPMFGRLIKAHPEIDVREVRRLTVQHSVGLIRHGDREYLLLLSPGDSLVLSQQQIEDVSLDAGSDA